MSCGLRDVMEIEALGTPAVLAASSAFRSAADDQSGLLGQPELRRVLVRHPIQNRTDEEVRGLARAALDDLLSAVSARVTELTSESLPDPARPELGDVRP